MVVQKKLAPHFPELDPIDHLLRIPAVTTQEQQIHVQALGKKIEAYILSICAAGGPNRASGEVRDKAVRAFYECVLAAERELRRIHDDFQLQ